MPFELNCGYHSCIFYNKNVNPRSQIKSAKELATKLRNLMIICKQSLQHVPKLQKQYHKKHAKPRSYAAGNNIWLKSKYIKTKNRNYKLETIFFSPFRVLLLVGKQAYKLKLLKK